jgi:enamine deaminase RidA (YjgF/YER057c/UK114 family)
MNTVSDLPIAAGSMSTVNRRTTGEAAKRRRRSVVAEVLKAISDARFVAEILPSRPRMLRIFRSIASINGNLPLDPLRHRQEPAQSSSLPHHTGGTSQKKREFIMQQSPINAASAPQPAGGYAQAALVTDASEWLVISGQIPATASSDVPDTFEDQAALAWANVRAQLETVGMSMENLVKVTTFLASREFNVQNREARRTALGDHTPALTVIITGIFDESWLLEIEAIAAR